MFARDHSKGISPVSIDCWKKWDNTGPNSVANSFRTQERSLSGPRALDGFKTRQDEIYFESARQIIIHLEVFFPFLSSINFFFEKGLIYPEEGRDCVQF